jgi:hypothetical protein
MIGADELQRVEDIKYLGVVLVLRINKKTKNESQLANESQLNELQKLQKRMMETIINCRLTGYIYSANAGFAELFISASCHRITNNTMMLLFKMENGLLPNYLCSSLHTVVTTPGGVMTSSYQINFLKASSQNCLLYNGMKIYNTMKRSAEFTVLRKISQFIFFN